MKIKRAVAPANARTFQIKPVKSFIKRYIGLAYVDPFPYPYAADALQLMGSFADHSVSRLVLDPPYSDNQLIEEYKNAGGFSITGNPSYWAKIKDEASRIVEPGGLVVTCSWNSQGIGRSRGFYKLQLLLIAHGAQHHDTIILLERRERLI